MNKGNTRRGLVFSDLHLLAHRSDGAKRVDTLNVELSAIDVLVLNGDIFDFRWSTLRDAETSQAAAVNWLCELRRKFPQSELHYVLGNHDCLAPFDQNLQKLAATLPRFYWHEYFLRLDSALFLHGDCAHARMDSEALDRYRQGWKKDRPRGRVGSVAYLWLDRLWFTLLAYHWYFPKRKTIQRVAYYLDRACPDWRHTVRHCYFGHTHLPFTGYAHEGIVFHNTGSAIRNMSFKPIHFEIAGT